MIKLYKLPGKLRKIVGKHYFYENTMEYHLCSKKMEQVNFIPFVIIHERILIDQSTIMDEWVG